MDPRLMRFLDIAHYFLTDIEDAAALFDLTPAEAAALADYAMVRYADGAARN